MKKQLTSLLLAVILCLGLLPTAAMAADTPLLSWALLENWRSTAEKDPLIGYVDIFQIGPNVEKTKTPLRDFNVSQGRIEILPAAPP